MLWLPESLRYMVARSKPAERIRRTLSRITSATLDGVTSFTVDEQKPADQQSSVGIIVSRDYLLGSLMLWLTYFMGLLIFYLLTSWMPLLMKDAGFSIAKAALLTSLFPLGGGIGTIVSGCRRGVDARHRPLRRHRRCADRRPVARLATRLCRHLRAAGHPGSARRIRAGDQA